MSPHPAALADLAGRREALPGRGRGLVLTRRRRPLGVVLAVAVALASVALSTAGADARSVAPASERAPGDPTRVLAVGDSVMEGAAGAIPAALPGRDVAVDTEVSRSTSRSVDSALARGTDWDVVVVLIGHNDAGSASAYQPPYRRLLDAYADVPRVVVMTLHEVRSSYPALNAFVRAEADARPNVTVLDWNSIVAANPGATAGDGLHLSNAGAALMAGEIAAQVTEVEAAATATTTTTAPPTTTTTTAPPTTSTTGSTTSTAPMPTTTTAPPGRVASSAASPSTAAVAALGDLRGRAEPPEPGPHTPRWAWPGVVVGFAALAAVLAREHRLRHHPTDRVKP